MLQPKHLAIVRAALTYWDEEMGAEPYAVYRHYLHSRDQNVVFTPEDVVNARAYFNDVIHRFGLLEVESGGLLPITFDEDKSPLTSKPNQKIVSVLIH